MQVVGVWGIVSFVLAGENVKSPLNVAYSVIGPVKLLYRVGSDRFATHESLPSTIDFLVDKATRYVFVCCVSGGSSCLQILQVRVLATITINLVMDH